MKKLFSKKVKEPEHEAQRSSNRGNAVMAGHSAQFAASTVGWLCGSGVDDWSRTLELCEGCSSSQKIAEESIRALRKEIEYGQPDAQQRAARLLVIMSRNTTDRFKLQMANKRFLDVVEKVYKSKNTQPNTKQALLKSFSVLAYEFQNDSDLSAVTNLYNAKLKRPEDPINGSALDASDPLFDPVTSQQGNRRERGPARRDLWKEAELGKSSANMLIDALGFTPIEDLDSNELIKEFYGNCQRSQSIFIDAIPHAAQKAEAAAQQHQPLPDGRPAIDEHQPTNEATLYQKLLDANQTLTEAFKMYDDCQRRKRQAEEEKMVQERSKADTRMHNGAIDPYSGLLTAPFAADGVGTSASNSREASPQPPTADVPPVTQPVPLQAQPAYHRQSFESASPPRSISPYGNLQHLETGSRSSSPASSLSRRLSTRNPYSTLLDQEQGQAPPRQMQDSPSRFAFRNPFASLTTSASNNSLNSTSPTSPVETAFPRAGTPDVAQSHELSPIAEDRNPFHSLGNLRENGLAANAPPISPATPRSMRTHRTLSNGSSILTPTHPSDKAYGKRRQVSLYGEDMEDLARQAELEKLEDERLRARYEEAASRESSGQPTAY